MQSNNFRDKEILNMPPDLEGITRPEKDKKTKKFTFLVAKRRPFFMSVDLISYL